MTSVVKSEVDGRRGVDADTPSTSAAFALLDVDVKPTGDFRRCSQPARSSAAAHESESKKAAFVKSERIKTEIRDEPSTSAAGERRFDDHESEEPEEFLNGEWEAEHIQYCNFNSITSRLNDSLSIALPGDAKRMKHGKIYKAANDKDSNDYKGFQDENRVVYRVGDFVYIEIDSTTPFMIGKIEAFRTKKGAGASVKMTRLYRRDDLNADSLSLLTSERRESGVDESSHDIRFRELFPSDAHVTQSVALLSGKCNVVHSPIKIALNEQNMSPDLFFFCVSYAPDTGRLTSCHPEIRVGENHQAVCPPLENSQIGDESDRDELIYKPNMVCAETEETVARYARSYRNMAILEHPQINELDQVNFKGDRVKLDALDCLNRRGYVAKDAIEQMIEDDKVYLEHQHFMTPEDTKKFVKGLRNYGKNFSKIIKEYLPLFESRSLVQYYYLWKKTGESFKPKKGSGASSKKALYAPPKRTTRSRVTEQTLVDYDSMSEDEEDGEKGRACHHCFSSDSRDWHHSGYERQLLCTDCREHFKKYGKMRAVDRPKDVPISLLRDEAQSSSNGIDDNEEGVKTRASNRRDRLRTPNEGDRTPVRNGAEIDPERRSTPQRFVKNNKRNYNVSTSSADEGPSPKKRDPRYKTLPPVLAKEQNEPQESDENEDSTQSPNEKQPSTSDADGAKTEDSLRRAKDAVQKESPSKAANSQGRQAAADDADESDSERNAVILAEYQLKQRNECKLTRNCADNSSCARTQLMLKTDGEPTWITRKKAREEQKKEKGLQAARNGPQLTPNIADIANRPRFDPVLLDPQAQFRQQLQHQLAAAQGIPLHALPRAQQEFLQHQMRLGVPPAALMRPAMNPLATELLNMNANRNELQLFATLAMHQQQQQQRQMLANSMGPVFSGAALPPGLNPASLIQAAAGNPASANALFYQMQQNHAVQQHVAAQQAAAQQAAQQAAAQAAQQQQARMAEEHMRRRQQMEREQQEQNRLQQQQQLINFQNLAMGMIAPQMIAAANNPQMNANALMGLAPNQLEQFFRQNLGGFPTPAQQHNQQQMQQLQMLNNALMQQRAQPKNEQR